MDMERVISQVPLEIRTASWFEVLSEYLEQQLKNLEDKDQLIEKQAHLIQQQAEQIATLKITLQDLKDEIARMKKLPKRPKFRPAGGDPQSRRGKPDSPSINASVSASHTITPKKISEEIKIAAVGVPTGSRFKGYQDYVVQELGIIVKDIKYRLEVWQAPDGKIIRGVLPKNLIGSHFGSELRAFVHHLYASSMTEPELFNFLTGFGIKVSKGQVHKLLMDEVERYYDVSKGILAAGLETAPYIRVDDTGAKHQHKSGYCTHVGGEYFAYFKTTFSKSRSNFLQILLQEKEGYCVNEAFIRHLGYSICKNNEKLLDSFKVYLGKQYDTVEEMAGLLDDLNIKNKALRAECIEAGLIGFISKTRIRPDQVLLSDRAGQFAILDHAACWVHMERPLRTVITSTDSAENALNQIRDMIWKLYAKVKIASTSPAKGEEALRQRTEINQMYDELIKMKTSSLVINTVIESFASYRAELLKALDHPELPLHNNASENDIRGMVKIRNVSGSTKSEDGRMYRDALMTIKKTCLRLGVSFSSYMKAWFNGEPIDLALMIRNKYQAHISGLDLKVSG
jgi:Transposase IS66 family